MTIPEELLRQWFEAHSRGDRTCARGLVSPDAVFQVPDATLCGFDEFMAWYDHRRDTRDSFRYEVLDILGGQRHAAAIIGLTDGASTWRQVAVYEVEGGRITAMTAYEDAPE